MGSDHWKRSILNVSHDKLLNQAARDGNLKKVEDLLSKENRNKIQRWGKYKIQVVYKLHQC